MDCKTATAIIEDFREGHLDQAGKTGLIDHMAQCKSCRQTLAHLDSIDQRLAASLGNIPVSPEFAERVAAAIRKSEIAPAAPAVIQWLRPAAIAAAACLVIGLTAWFLMPALRHHAPAPRPVVVKAASEFEPPADQPYAMGQPFVIGDDSLRPYSGKTSIAVHQVRGRTPELIVEAFPE